MIWKDHIHHHNLLAYTRVLTESKQETHGKCPSTSYLLQKCLMFETLLFEIFLHFIFLQRFRNGCLQWSNFEFDKQKQHAEVLIYNFTEVVSHFLSVYVHGDTPRGEEFHLFILGSVLRCLTKTKHVKQRWLILKTL